MEHIAKSLKELDVFCKENEDMSYGELLEEVEAQVAQINKYAEDNGIPLVIDAEEIMDKHRDVGYDDYVSESEEEESSSYDESYEEEESSEE